MQNWEYSSLCLAPESTAGATSGVKFSSVILNRTPGVDHWQEMIDCYSDPHPFLLVKLNWWIFLFSLMRVRFLLPYIAKWGIVVFILTNRRSSSSYQLRGSLKMVWMLLLRTTVLKLTNATQARVRESNTPRFFLPVYMWHWLNLMARQIRTIKHGYRRRHTSFPLASRSFHRRLKNLKLRVDGRS